MGSGKMAMRSTCLVVILLLGASLSEARKLKQSLSVTTIDSDYKSNPDVKTPAGALGEGHDLLASVFGTNVATILEESESVGSGGAFVSTSGNAVASVGAHARGDSVTHSSFVSAGTGKADQKDGNSLHVIGSGSGSSSSVSSESSLSTTVTSGQLSDAEDEEEVKVNKTSKKSGSKKSGSKKSKSEDENTQPEITVVPSGNVEASFLVSANGDSLAFDGKGAGPVSFSAGITSSSKSKDHDH